MEGWLTKSPLGGGLLSRHRRRYCTLRGAVLDWSADEQQHARGEPLGRVSIEGAQVVRQKAAELTLMLTGGQKLVLRGDQLDRWEAAFKEATLGAASSASPSAVTLSEKTLLVPQLSFSSNAPTELRSLFQSAVEAQRRDGASTYAGAEQLFGPRGVHPGRWGISKKQFEEFGESVKQAMRKGEIATQPDPSKRFYYPQSKFDNPNIGPNMHQVTRDLIKPRTAKHSMLPGASYAMLQNLSTCGLLCSLFISHCWDEGVFEFIRNTLKAWPDDCEGAYVCFLSNPQVDEVLSKIGLDGGISASPFYRVLHEKPRPKLMLMLANGNTPIHSRLWCVLEAHEANETKLEVKLAGNAVHLLSSDSSILARHKDDLAQDSEAAYTRQLLETTDPEERRMLIKKLDDNNAAQTQVRLQLLMMSDAELISLARATASRSEDERAIREHIKGKEAAIEALAVKLIRDFVSGADSSQKLSSVSGPLDSIDLSAERIDLSGKDLSQPANLLQLIKWMRMRPAAMHLKLHGCKLDDSSVRLFEISAKEDALPRLRTLDLIGNAITPSVAERLQRDCLCRDVDLRVAESDCTRRQYLHLAVQSAASVVTGHVSHRADFSSQLDSVCHELNQICSQPGRSIPICVSEGSSPALAARVRNGEAHVLVWIATGRGWELGGNPATTSFDDLARAVRESDPPPNMVIVCLGYGARVAGEKLHAAGAPSVMWMRAALDEELSLERLFFSGIEPSIRKAHASGRLTQDEFEQCISDEMRGVSGAYGLIGGVPSLEWSNAPSASREVLNECLRPLQATNIAVASGPVARGPLRSCDVRAASELKAHLEDKTKRLVVLCTDTAAEGEGRCRAVALEACSSYVHTTGAYKVVYRVSTNEELAEADRQIAVTPDRVLLWFHIIPGGLSADDVMERMRRATALTHVVLTCDASESKARDALTDDIDEFVEVELPAEKGSVGIEADSIHQELRLSAKLDGTLCSLLALFSVGTLLAALQELLPGKDRPIAALYHDDDDASRAALIVRMHVSDVGLLHEQRDDLLTGVFEVKLTEKLGRESRLEGAKTGVLTVEVDKTQFAEVYEKSVMELEKLTPHQRKKLEECEGEQRVHVMAPAGAGKTYIAMYQMLKLLKQSDTGLILFIARNPALCYFAVRWLCRRVSKSERRGLVSRLHILFLPWDEGPRACSLKNGRLEVSATPGESAYAMVVVDESHHLYKDAPTRAQIERYLTHEGGQRLTLLSDISQSLGSEIDYPPCYIVKLTEVVRCSKRIVQAASSFQLGGEAKLVTQCHHESTGPPLKSFLFDLDADDAPEARLVHYSERVLTALQHVMSDFPGLDLHDRVAILVPDQAFADGLRPLLVEALKNAKRLAKGRHFSLIDASEAASIVGARRVGSTQDGEALVLDSLENFDGLERLIVIAVSLDAPLDENAEDTLETRSRLYRALTRAHMMALVVNESVTGGWLQWLNNVKLQVDARFDRKAEMARLKADASEMIVKKRLEEIKVALQAALQQRKLETQNSFKLTQREDKLLRKRIDSDVQKRGETAAAAAEAQLQVLSQQREALRRAASARAVQLSESDEGKLLAELHASARGGDDLDTVIDSVLRAWQEKQEQMEQIRSALTQAIEAEGLEIGGRELAQLNSACSRSVGGGEQVDAAVQSQLFRVKVRVAFEARVDLSSKERRVLTERVCATRGADSAQTSVRTSADAWATQKAEVLAAVHDAARRDLTGLGADDLKEMADGVISAVLEGEAAEAAVEEAVMAKKRLHLTISVGKAVRAAIEARELTLVDAMHAAVLERVAMQEVDGGADASTAAEKAVAQYNVMLLEIDSVMEKETQGLSMDSAHRAVVHVEIVSDVLNGKSVLEAVSDHVVRWQAAQADALEQVVVEQTVWDTAGNSAAKVVSDLEFNPMQEVPSEEEMDQLAAAAEAAQREADAQAEAGAEAMNMREAGFPISRPLNHFFSYYKMVADDPSALRAPSLKKRCELLLTQLNVSPDTYRFGKTQIFFQNDKLIDALDKARAPRMIEYVVQLQSYFRMLQDYVKYRACRRAVLRLQGFCQSWEIRRAYVEVRTAGRIIQRYARTYLAHKKLQDMLESDDPDLTPAKKREILEKILHPERFGRGRLGLSGKLQPQKVHGEEDGEVEFMEMPKFQVSHEGWLKVRIGGKRSTKRKVYVSLRQGVVSLFEDGGGYKALLSYNLASCDMIASSPTMPTSLTVVRKEKVYEHLVRFALPTLGRPVDEQDVVIFEADDGQTSALKGWADKLEESICEAKLVDSYKILVNLDGEEDDKPVNQKVIQVIKEGYLRTKKPGKKPGLPAQEAAMQDLKRSWERRYMVLYNDGKLRYYDSRLKKEEKGSLDLRFFALQEIEEDMEIDEEEEAEERQARKVANQFFKIEKGKQFGLYSGKHIFYLYNPDRAVCDEWIATLQTTLAVLYQKSPFFSQELGASSSLRISLMDGNYITMPMDENTRTRDVIRFMCKKLVLNNETEWGLIEQWDHPGLPGGMSERKLRNDEMLLDQTTLAWEQAARKRFGVVSMVPQTVFQLVLRKQTSVLPQARTKKEQHLEFCQALADVREGRFTTQNKEEIFELAALAIFKDLHEGMSDAEEWDAEEWEIILEEGQLTAQLSHYLPAHWFKSLELKRVPVQRQQIADWDAAVVRSFNELTRAELDELMTGKTVTYVRKIVAAFRMETELNAVAATRMFIERVRLAPLCFSTQYIAEMWRVDKILKVLVVVNYGGLHIYQLGANPLLLSSFDFNTLVSWSSTDDLLIIKIIYAAKGEVAKRREELRFLTSESYQMRRLLSKYAEAVLADIVKRMKELEARDWAGQSDTDDQEEQDVGHRQPVTNLISSFFGGTHPRQEKAFDRFHGGGAEVNLELNPILLHKARALPRVMNSTAASRGVTTTANRRQAAPRHESARTQDGQAS